MVRLKKVLKSLKKTKNDEMKDKAKQPKEKKLKSSKSLIDVTTLFKDKKKQKQKDRDRLVASSWDVSEVNGHVPQETAPEPHKKGHLRRASSVDNLSLYSVSRDSTDTPVREACSGTSSRSPSTATGPHDSSDDSLSAATTATLGFVDNRQSFTQITPAPSPRFELNEDHYTYHKSWTKKFLRRFKKVDPSEKVLDYFACALVADILLQGTLFITDNYFAFHSNIFGYVSKILIPISQVTNLRKEKTAKFIPNAIRVQTENGKTYVFSSLLSRENTFKLMMFSWRKVQKRNPSSEDENSHIVTQVTEVFEEDTGSFSGDESALDEEANEAADDTGTIYHEPRKELQSANGSRLVSSTPLTSSMASQAASSSSEATTIEANYRLKSQASSEVTNPKALPIRRQQPKVASRKISTDNRQSSSKSSSVEEQQSTSQKEPKAQVASITSVILTPFRMVASGVSNVAILCEGSVMSTASSLLVILLLVSAAFMLHRVEELGKQMSTGEGHFRGDLYEEVLQMQQRLHSVLASDVEKNIDTQLKQLATVRESLESMIYLFNEQAAPSTKINDDSTSNSESFGS